MAERLRDLGNFMGVSHFEARFWAEGLFCNNIYGPLNMGMITPQLHCWNFSHKETL